MATTPKVLTFAEFEQLSEPPNGRLELRQGEPVFVPPARLKHVIKQDRLRALLEQAVGSQYMALVECGFRVGNNYRIPDVAVLSRERVEATDPDGILVGAPELVIEILSPSNRDSEMIEKEALCLENGAREFWVVDLEHRLVRVSTSDGHTHIYKPGGQIPLHFGGSLAVDSIFS